MGAAKTKVLFQNFQIFSNPNYTLCLGWTTTKDMPLHSRSNVTSQILFHYLLIISRSGNRIEDFMIPEKLLCVSTMGNNRIQHFDH